MSSGEIVFLGYAIGVGICFLIAAIIIYLACIQEWGIVIGGTIGVIPSVIIGAISAILWPLILPFVVAKLVE